MNKQLWLDFQDALEDVKNDLEAKVLIITGDRTVKWFYASSWGGCVE